MKIGDLVRFVATEPGYHEYPQYKGKLGVIVRERNKDCFFVVNVNGKNHPYYIHKNSMEVVNESR